MAAPRVSSLPSVSLVFGGRFLAFCRSRCSSRLALFSIQSAFRVNGQNFCFLRDPSRGLSGRIRGASRPILKAGPLSSRCSVVTGGCGGENAGTGTLGGKTRKPKSMGDWVRKLKRSDCCPAKKANDGLKISGLSSFAETLEGPSVRRVSSFGRMASGG